MLNKQKGNMYGFVTHTWNPIKGKCLHDCSYCYMKRFPQKEIRLDEKCFKDNLGSGNFIFVGSSTDMFANNVPDEWIRKVYKYCIEFNNTYLFQSKDPLRFHHFAISKSIFATTIETNRNDLFKRSGYVPGINRRAYYMKHLSERKMITIEPIMDFDVIPFVDMLKAIRPFQVNIGADSGHNGLPEPPKEKVLALIAELEKFTTVYQKDNLRRLLI